MTSFILRAARGGLASFVLAAIVVMALPAAAQAATASQQRPQVPGYYRLALGDIEVTALYDGYVKIDPAILKGVSEQDVQPLLARQFMPTSGGVPTADNAYLVDTGSKLVLVDTGAGACFGPTLGRVPDNMRAAGYDPAEVDAVLITHLHPDHVCGLVTAGQELMPGITSVAEVGHTPGHTAYRVDGPKHDLLIWGNGCSSTGSTRSPWSAT